VLIWTTLTFANISYQRKRRGSTESARLSSSWTRLLESISGFHAAQCFFSIPLAVAVFFTDPFKLDPLNAFGLLPVALNGLLPTTFTLMMLYHFRNPLQEPLKWYPILLTNVSYLLNSIVLFAAISYLAPIKNKGIALKETAFQSLGGIDSCGGSTAIALCLATQRDSPPAFLLQQFPNLAFAGIRLAPFIWAICTICLGTINYRHLRQTELGQRLERLLLDRDTKETITPRRPYFSQFLRVLHGVTLYYAASVTIVLSLIFQAIMFYTYLELGLVDLKTWSLGQIVAITVWIPPVIDYLHLQFGERETKNALPYGSPNSMQNQRMKTSLRQSRHPTRSKMNGKLSRQTHQHTSRRPGPHVLDSWLNLH
jgi:hypothetical protein